MRHQTHFVFNLKNLTVTTYWEENDLIISGQGRAQIIIRSKDETTVELVSSKTVFCLISDLAFNTGWISNSNISSFEKA